MKNGAVLSVILQEYETLIIEKSMAFMEEHNCVVTSYNYDGFQIKKVDAIDDLIHKLNTLAFLSSYYLIFIFVINVNFCCSFSTTN